MLDTLHDPTKGTWLRKKQRNYERLEKEHQHYGRISYCFVN